MENNPKPNEVPDFEGWMIVFGCFMGALILASSFEAWAILLGILLVAIGWWQLKKLISPLPKEPGQEQELTQEREKE